MKWHFQIQSVWQRLYQFIMMTSKHRIARMYIEYYPSMICLHCQSNWMTKLKLFIYLIEIKVNIGIVDKKVSDSSFHGIIWTIQMKYFKSFFLIVWSYFFQRFITEANFGTIAAGIIWWWRSRVNQKQKHFKFSTKQISHIQFFLQHL